jgi:hypothetical protein
MIDYPSMLIGGSILIVAIVLLWLWNRTEARLKKLEENQ